MNTKTVTLVLDGEDPEYWGYRLAAAGIPAEIPLTITWDDPNDEGTE